MTYFTDRSLAEREIIAAAFNFEEGAILHLDPTPNPYKAAILAMQDGAEVWEGLEVYFETWHAHE